MRDPLETTELDARPILVGVGLLLTALVALGVANPTALGVVAIWIGIIGIIMIHEAGHYFTAKLFNMKVTEYFLGFGPRVWSMRKGETEYGVKAIPAGGYVRIVGMNNLEEVDPEDEPRTYRSKPYYQRFIVVIAGITTHFVMAIVLIFLLLAVIGIPEQQPVIDRLEEGAPAVEAGFEPGDRIVSVDGQPVQEWNDVVEYVRARPGEEIDVAVRRGSERVEAAVTLATHPDEEDVGFLGVGPVVESETRPVVTAAKDSVTSAVRGTREVVGVFAGFFTPSRLGEYVDALAGKDTAENRFVSPVGATDVARQAVESGLYDVVFFFASINLVVGTLNLMPLPPLDGGHIAVATYEKIASLIRRRRVQVDMAKVMPVAMIVVMLFIFIAVSSLWLDIFQGVDTGG